MAIESNFFSLFQNLKLDDPWLPSKPWESIPSESGRDSHSKTSTSNSLHQPTYDPSTVSEANLVRLVINALQGVESTLASIEKLSESFCTSPADRTSHRIPSLWYRSSSTNALGKILKSVGGSGFVAFLLRKFVDYFLCMNSNVDGRGREEGVERKQVVTELAGTQTVEKNETAINHEYSLVNQAFAVAVGKVLEGYICSLDTLYASVQMRRSVKKVDASADISSGVGCLTSVVHSEITLLEVYLHTKELRTHIVALGNICFLKHVGLAFSACSLDDLTVEAVAEFSNFPRGANLLTYLYTQLLDADPVHHALLKFLFVRSCEPYCGFIKSWIYQAKINDPYKEFIVEYVEDSTPYSHASDGSLLASIKERNGVAVPCFLRRFSLPLLRAGQQLQVLIKLLELCRWMYPGNQMFKDILPCWSGASSDHLYNLAPLTFSKGSIEEMEVVRQNMYRMMQERLQIHFTKLDIKYQQISRNVRRHFLSLLAVKLLCLEGIYLIAPTLDSDASSAMDEFSYEVDPLESSECSSLDSASELNESEEPTKPHENSIEMELKSLSASRLFTNLYKVEHMLSKPLQSEKSHALEGACNKHVGRMDSISHYVDCHHKEAKLSHISEHFQSADATRSSLSETQYIDYQSMTCWPLGGLLKNPFYLDGGYSDGTQSQPTNCSLEMPDRDTDILRVGLSYYGEVCSSNISLPNHARRDIQLGYGICASSDSFLPPSWNLKYNCNLFNMNPMLTKYAWHTMDESRGRDCMGYKQSSFPYFNFSSVENPSKVFGERLPSSLGQGLQGAIPLFDDSAVRMDEHVEEQGHDGNDIPVDQRNLSYADSSLTCCENQQEDKVSKVASGGDKWEHSLSYFGNNVIHTAGDNRQSSESTSDIPLDVVIDKCILQEILLQYKYVSSFTIKLLEEGFDLREHFLALRRYHFMEFADWADLFIMSLWRHKWYAAEGNKRISEIQGFLDMAVQRSSCEGDPYKERLFVYMKGDGMMPLPTSTFGVHAFDFIALGFRVDWPVSIVLTPGALKIYSEIFSFLIQVKLAVFSLTDVWCLLKDLVNLFRPNHNCGFNERDKSYFNILMKLRYQVNHFVSTLQQYVLSQLSHVSWSRFLHSLKHQVKDMLDVESVHMAYLADSLNICFLSDETQPVAGIIENILQSALDFCSCFTAGGWEVGSDQRDSSRLLDRLNFTQVLTIKESFEKNLKELYLCYLKSPKHGKYGLSHFWEYLNYNDYYSNVIGNGISLYAF
ncbi:Spc97/Spc98 [Macleaya cordata]|uniref:Spc97/Spc98 n=1 Tax=Macleaya cordata TaxID=56857 RepID=A0A200PRQ3_MACCD|nr:Spc97/Spc98 [Macleaya cordata]